MGNRKRYSKEELREFVLKFLNSEGRYPERRDWLHNPVYPSSSQMNREFGSWGRAMIEMGFRSTPKEHKRKVKAQCKFCGTPFTHYKDKQECCSLKCRDAFALKFGDGKHTDTRSYRVRAFKAYGAACERCGYKEFTQYSSKRRVGVASHCPISLQVHHLDGNRKRNGVENLAVLCPNCHTLATVGVTRYLRSKGVLRWEDKSVEEWQSIVEDSIIDQKNYHKEYTRRRKR